MVFRTSGTIFVLSSMTGFVSLGCSGAASSGQLVDSRARSILWTMSKSLEYADAFSFSAHTSTDEALGTGQVVQFSTDRRVLVRRPDSLFVESDGDRIDRRVWYDGDTLTILDEAQNVYAATSAPSTIDRTLDFGMREYGVNVPLADFVVAEPYGSLMKNVRSGQYVGLHDVDGHACHHLAFRQESIDWQIWIDSEQQSLPRKFVITYKTEPGSPQFVAILDGWDLSPAVPDAAFAFAPPTGANRVEMDSLIVP